MLQSYNMRWASSSRREELTGKSDSHKQTNSKSVHVPLYYERHVSNLHINCSSLCVNISWSQSSSLSSSGWPAVFVYIPDEVHCLQARPGIAACFQRSRNKLCSSDVLSSALRIFLSPDTISLLVNVSVFVLGVMRGPSSSQTPFICSHVSA